MDVIRVGAFELLPSERKLRGSAGDVELGARAFDLLLVLVETPGRLVTKATLLERVWPRLVVDENNLPAQIAGLRRVLGADAIRTVPGFGYRLELPVEAPGAVPPPAPAAPDPAPRLALPRRNWPDRLAPIIGRADDLVAVDEALARSCLVTVVGGAGVGKTRLAQEVLGRAGDTAGAAWVALGSLDDIRHVPTAIAVALGLALADDREGFTALGQALEQVPVLLVLDGAEHLAAALAPALAALVSTTENVRVLATSQTPLGVAGEVVYRLAALPVPELDASHAETALSAAVALFAERAAAADRRFELSTGNSSLIGAICRRLDGNPLALELAAARVPSLGAAQLLERLDDRFRLLKAGGGARDPRHGALQAAFEWSYALLGDAEQRVFRRLGTFAGSFSLEAAAASVADAEIDSTEAIDLIGRLVDRSLVTALPRDPPRYVLLETARLFALERLETAAELESARRSMAVATLALLDAAYLAYWSEDEATWLERYGAELENVRAALLWALAHDRVLAIGLYGSSWPLFVEMDLFAEARHRYESVLRLIGDSVPTARVGRFWEAIATYDSTRQYDRARYAAEIAVRLHAATGDARARYHAAMLLALNWRGDDAAARRALGAAQSLEDAAWPARLLTEGAVTEGALLASAGDYAKARVAYGRAVRLALTISERQALAATVQIADLDLAAGDTVGSLQLGRPLALSLRHSGYRATRFDLLVTVFAALLVAGEFAEARSIGAELLDLARRLDSSKLYSVLDAMAYLAASEQRFEAAARITRSADLARALHGEPRRRPAEERMRRAVAELLDAALPAGWSTCEEIPIDETSACRLALGLDA